jgi:Ca2+-binding RTX toxin-like protein
MKKATLSMLAVLAALAATLSAHAGTLTYNVVLAGGQEANDIHIWLTSDGRTYVIESIVPLEVGGTVCQNPPNEPNELICQAAQVSAFAVNAVGGNDRVKVAAGVPVPVTLRGGAGRDILVGGAGPDLLVGGKGPDKLVGRSGNDVLVGGPGNDQLFGGRGNDLLKGGPGRDKLVGGPGHNVIRRNIYVPHRHTLRLLVHVGWVEPARRAAG